jgi:Mrp family chromosome partitioning ATPase
LSDVIHATGVENLFIMPAGDVTHGNPAEWLSSRTAQALFDEVRERFHYVLVDTPPIQTAADVGVIGGMCSGVIMVVRMHRTPEPLARQSVRWLQANNLTVLGCLLAGATAHPRPPAYKGPE